MRIATKHNSQPHQQRGKASALKRLADPHALGLLGYAAMIVYGRKTNGEVDKALEAVVSFVEGMEEDFVAGLAQGAE